MRSAFYFSSTLSCIRQPRCRNRMTPVVGAGFVLVLLQIALPSVCMATSTPSLGTEEATPGFETVSYDSGGVQVHALLAKPEGTGKHPAVIVIHDSQGLTDEFRDIAPTCCRGLCGDGSGFVIPDRRHTSVPASRIRHRRPLA
jgi:hypothetical protein